QHTVRRNNRRQSTQPTATPNSITVNRERARNGPAADPFQFPATIGQKPVLNFIAAQVHSAFPFSANSPASPAESYASVDEEVPRLNFPHPPSVIHQNSANGGVDAKSQPFG
ncbi:hypothetical protein FIBSPDRAFT_1055803, partial [Athelia psychrophila]